jgi:hypothetical protein
VSVRPILLTECTSGSLSSQTPLPFPSSLSPAVGDEATSSFELENGVADGVSPHMLVPFLALPPICRAAVLRMGLP